MRALVQRVSNAEVIVDQLSVGKIGPGLLVLLGIHLEDTQEKALWLAKKLATLRIFTDIEGKMNLSIQDIQGQILVVSQFTLYGNCSSGRRPEFLAAAPPQVALPLYECFISCLKEQAQVPVETGIFGAKMQVNLTNDGPVTLLLDTP